MDAAIKDRYGNHVRVRVCGLCWRDGELLMVNHRGINTGDFWAPPGGGVEFLESTGECLRREFLEETGLRVSPGRFLFVCEYIGDPLHTVELFFEVSVAGGNLRKGTDPELPIIDDVRFMSSAEIAGIQTGNLHGIFRLVSSPERLRTLTGFFRI